MARDINYWKRVANGCATLQEYEMQLITRLESMTIAQLCAWQLTHGSKITRQTLNICIETGAIKYNHNTWLKALRESLQHNKEIDLFIQEDERPNGKGTKFLPFLL